MRIKYYQNYYNLDQVYKIYVSDPMTKDGGGLYETMQIYFTARNDNTSNTAKLDALYLSSDTDSDVYDKVKTYLLKNIIYSNK